MGPWESLGAKKGVPENTSQEVQSMKLGEVEEGAGSEQDTVKAGEARGQ